jgi:multidrug efflux pump subunit AcrA (membrane-fusion protein)
MKEIFMIQRFNRLGKWRWPVIAAAFFLVLVVVVLIARSAAAPNIPIAEVQYGEFVINLEERGELQAVKSVSVNVPRHVRGNLRIVALAEDGSRVEEGDFLVQFDTSEASQEVEESRNELENAKAELASLKANIKSTMAQLRTTFETQKYSYEQAKLRYEQMKYEAAAKRREQELNLKKAELMLEQAEKKIQSQEIINRADIAKAELQVKQRQLRLNEDLHRLESLTLRAPIGGLVVHKEIWGPNGMAKVKVGDTPWRGMTLVEIPDLSQMMVRAKINEINISQVAEEQQVIVKVDALADETFYGQVARVAKLATRERGSEIKEFDIEILLQSSDSRLRPGMTAQCDIITDRIPDQLYIPLECVFQEMDTTVVYPKSRGFKALPIELGVQNNNFIVVKAGLEQGQKVSLYDPSKPIRELGKEAPSIQENKPKSNKKSSERMIMIG